MSDLGGPDWTTLLEIHIAAPRETVWTALRDKSKLSRWFGWEYDGLADEIQFIFFAHVKEDTSAFVLSFDRWEGTAHRIELVERPHGTTLRVLQSKDRPGPGWDESLDEMAEGWLTFFSQLKLMLEHHRNSHRRTIYLSGRAVTPRAGATESLNIAGLFDALPGSHYTADTGPGDEISGTVAFKSSFQLGLMVEQWGNGLLAVIDRHPSEAAPFPGGSAVLTTYGLDDPAFAALEQRWRGWWNERFPPA